MPELPAPLCVALTVVALPAGVFDLRWRRIPNWLCLAGLAAGFSLQPALAGWQGLQDAAAGFALAAAVYLVLYGLRAVGGGDVKLMAALGAIAGPRHWPVLFVLTAILGGVFAVVLMLVSGRARSTLRNVGFILGELLRGRAPFRRRPELDVSYSGALRLPHAASIALATLVYAGFR